MEARGYPMATFDQRAADISVDHPQVVDHYRIAHEIATRRWASGVPDTEALRQATLHYRALFADLLETAGSEWTATSRSTTGRAVGPGPDVAVPIDRATALPPDPARLAPRPSPSAQPADNQPSPSGRRA